MTKRLGRGDWFFVRDDGNLRVPPNLVLGVSASVIATTQLAADPTSPVAAPADHADRYIDDADVSFSLTTGGNHRATFDGIHNKDRRQTVDRERFSRTGSRPLSWICFAAECTKLEVDKHDEPGLLVVETLRGIAMALLDAQATPLHAQVSQVHAHCPFAVRLEH